MTTTEAIDHYFERDPAAATHLDDVLRVLRAAKCAEDEIHAALAEFRRERFRSVFDFRPTGTWVWGLVFKAETYQPKFSKFREPRWRVRPKEFERAGLDLMMRFPDED